MLFRSTVPYQAPLSMEFSRQEYWSGLPFPPPEDLPDPEIEPASFMSPSLTGRFFIQAPLSVGFSRQECWSGLPFPPPEDLPNPGIKPASLMSPALAGGFFTTRAALLGSSPAFINPYLPLHLVSALDASSAGTLRRTKAPSTLTQTGHLACWLVLGVDLCLGVGEDSLCPS